MSHKHVFTTVCIALMAAFGHNAHAEQETAGNAAIVSVTSDSPDAAPRLRSAVDPDEPQDGPLTPAFSGKGTHKCQSRDSIGHTCTVSIVNRNDCQEVFYALKNDDCCPRSEFRGNSIEFNLDYCSPL